MGDVVAHYAINQPRRSLAPLLMARLIVDVVTPSALAIAAVVRPNSSMARKAITARAPLTPRRRLPERNSLPLTDLGENGTLLIC